MAEQTYKFRGLDVRSNQLDRAGNTARDCSNVRLDENNRLVKISEYAGLNLPYDLTSTPASWDDELPTGSEIFDMVEFNGDLILFVKVPPLTSVVQDFATSLYKYEIGSDTLSVIPSNTASYDFAEVGWSNWTSKAFDGKISSFEKDGCLYFQSASNSNSGLFSSFNHVGQPLMGKYDGTVWHAAGVDDLINLANDDEDNGVLTGSDYYFRFVYMTVDNVGNQTFGVVKIKQDVAAPLAAFGGFTKATGELNYNTAFFVSRASQSINTGAGPQVITIDADYGGYIGSTVMVQGPLNILYKFEVTNIVGTSLTLDNGQFLDDGQWTNSTGATIGLTSGSILGNTLVLAYTSRDFSAGFTFNNFAMCCPQSFAGSVNNLVCDVTVPVAVPDWAAFAFNYSDFYGVQVKTNPPPAKQAREYGDACILVGDDLLYFSDLSISGSVENFTAFDRFAVGEQEKGNIASFFSNETFIAVFREREAYLVVGNIFTGNFRVQSYRSTGVGGASPTAVIEVEGQCLFMSNRGPHIAMENGSFSKIGNRIEPIFVDGVLGLNPDLLSAHVKLDIKKELIYMPVKSNDGAASDFVIVFDYRNSEWFKYNISMGGGIAVIPETGVSYYSDGVDVYAEQATYSSGIDAYWTSNFDTLRKASFKKRFQRLHLFLTTLASGTIGFQAYKDWITSSAYTDVTIEPSSTIPMDNRRLNPKLAYSNSFNITSKGKNVMEIDGFEYSYEIEQESLNDDNRI